MVGRLFDNQGDTTVGWRAWYEDARVFDSATTEWESLPETGCVGVVEYLGSRYREMVWGGDWYVMDAGRVRAVPSERWGAWAEPPNGLPAKLLKRSGALSHARWMAARATMLAAVEAP